MIAFQLYPFAQTPDDHGLRLTGHVRRDAGRLHLAYCLEGPLAQLAVAPPADVPQRRHELWKTTCFEAFIQPVGDRGYWELNLSPAGHWNLYRFDAYRQGMREARAAFAVQAQKAEALVLSADGEIDGLGGQAVRMGVSAVLAAHDGDRMYYALAHPAPTPDFHDPRGFLVIA